MQSLRSRRLAAEPRLSSSAKRVGKSQGRAHYPLTVEPARTACPGHILLHQNPTYGIQEGAPKRIAAPQTPGERKAEMHKLQKPLRSEVREIINQDTKQLSRLADELLAQDKLEEIVRLALVCLKDEALSDEERIRAAKLVNYMTKRAKWPRWLSCEVAEAVPHLIRRMIEDPQSCGLRVIQEAALVTVQAVRAPLTSTEKKDADMAIQREAAP